LVDWTGEIVGGVIFAAIWISEIPGMSIASSGSTWGSGLGLGSDFIALTGCGLSEVVWFLFRHAFRYSILHRLQRLPLNSPSALQIEHRLILEMVDFMSLARKKNTPLGN
jgi:hypothetical protein